MFSIISTMFLGIGIGYVLRNWSILQKTEKTISLTIFLLLFILGVSIGSNSLIVNNLGKFGWQAVILASSGVLGSLIAARLVLQLFCCIIVFAPMLKRALFFSRYFLL